MTYPLRDDGMAVVPPDPFHRRDMIPFRRTNTNDLMAKSFPPVNWVVPGYISEGFLVLAGRQKLGKTWLAIDMALAVAVGGIAMGSICCDQGDVLYIDMENGDRRIQGRITTLYPDERNRPDFSRLDWVTEARQLGSGFIEQLEDWRLSVSSPRLVVIDVLQRIKPPGSMARNAYENDYSTWAPLQHWATGHGIAVLGLHHTKKGGADDPLEALSGSNGLSACADTTLVLDSDQNGKTLYVRGRDVEEKETALIFAGGAWSILGEAADVRRSDERTKIIAALTDHDEPMTPAEISVATLMPNNNVRQLLLKMAKASEIYKAGKSRYWLHPTNPRNIDNGGNEAEESEQQQCGADDEPQSPITDIDNTAAKFDVRIYRGADGETSRHRQCSHCHAQGGAIVKVWHGTIDPWLHRECIDAWIADYEERVA
ncbi:AAA family ATPase [Leptospira interrogans]